MNALANTLVHVVEDDVGMRTALKRLLTGAGYRVKEYASVGEFLVSDPGDWTGCLLLDLMLNGPNGLDLQQVLLRQVRSLPIVFMSAYGDVANTVKAMKAGAVDFLVKPFDRETLLNALERAQERAAYASDVNALDRAIELGEREQYVLRGIVAGRRNKQIAAELGLSERTIKSCRAELMRKYGADSLAGLLRRVDRVAFAA